jgi:hypothetical protein
LKRLVSWFVAAAKKRESSKKKESDVSSLLCVRTLLRVSSLASVADVVAMTGTASPARQSEQRLPEHEEVGDVKTWAASCGVQGTGS